MNAITQIEPNALVPRDMDQAIRLAQVMASAKMVPQHLQGDVGTCLMIVEQALRWHMSPFAVAQCTSNIRGKLMFEGKLVAAAVESSGAIEGGFDYDFKGDGDARSVTVKARRVGEPNPRQITVRLGDVKTTNEWWAKQPDQQLVYSATRAWARRWTPSAILGVYAPEEFGKGSDEFHGPTLEGGAVLQPAGDPAPSRSDPSVSKPADGQEVPAGKGEAPPPPPPQSEPKANGNGRPTIRTWLDDFQRDCSMATNKDEAEAILKRDRVLRCREVFAAYPKVIEDIEHTRQEMIDRFWSHDAEMENIAP